MIKSKQTSDDIKRNLKRYELKKTKIGDFLLNCKKNMQIDKYKQRIILKSPPMSNQGVDSIILDKKISFEKPSKQIAHLLAQITELNNKNLFEADLSDNDRELEHFLHEIHTKLEQASSNMNRKQYYSFLTVYYNNLAYIYHKYLYIIFMGQRNDQPIRTENSLEHCVRHFESLRGFIHTREENITYTVELVKLYLQTCAILSQSGKHHLSLMYAEKGLEKLLECFRVLQALCIDQYMLLKNRQPAVVNKANYPKIEKICFQSRVIHQAKQLLDQMASLPLVHKLLIEQRTHFEKIMNRLYFWRRNSDLNEKVFRKQLQIDKHTIKRNLLGLPKCSQTIQKFHIGALMSLELKKICLNRKMDKYYLLSAQRLQEMILYASVCYFTLGTETRFNQLEEDIETLKILDKYKKLSHDDQIHKCKILHLKSVEIAGKYLPNSNQYFTHLVQSFNKNYKIVLDEIIQVTETPTKIQEPTNHPEHDQPTFQYGIRKPKLKNNKQKHVPRESLKHSKSHHQRKQNRSHKKNIHSTTNNIGGHRMKRISSTKKINNPTNGK